MTASAIPIGVEHALDVRIPAVQLLDELPDPAMIIHRQHYRIRAANRRCEDLTGYCLDELVGADCQHLAPVRPLPRATMVDWRSLTQEAGFHEEVLLRRKDGSHAFASVNVSFIEGEPGGLALLVVRETSARRKLERELITKHVALRDAYADLAQANADLAQANARIKTTQQWAAHMDKMATLGRFAAGVAHEVNNPIAFVLENLRILRDELGDAISSPPADGADARIADLSKLIAESLVGAERVTAIAKQIHTFSNINDSEVEDVDLRELIDSAIVMVRNQLTYRARLDLQYLVIPKIHCVPSQIAQVLINLLVNAAQALDPNNAAVNRVVVRLTEKDDSVVIEVEDNGAGIATETLPHILEPFFTTKSAGQGSGLGLAISANIVKGHGGRIDVETEAGVGTLMRVVLPRRGPLKLREKKEPASRLPLRRKIRLLLVDDEPMLLRSLKRSLGRVHDVTIAHGASSALTQIQKGADFDAIIADLMMPGMNGIQLFEELNRRDPALASRMIFMSGGIFDPLMKQRLNELDAQLLPKPFNTTQLLEVLGGVESQGRQ